MVAVLHRRCGERGHTIIEVMIATAVFTIGVLGMVPLFYRNTEGVVSASKLTQATGLATSQLNILQQVAFTDAALTAGTHTETANLLADGTAATSSYGTADGSYYRSWTVVDKEYNSDIPGNDYKVITLTVSWYDGTAKRVRSVNLVGGRGVVE